MDPPGVRNGEGIGQWAGRAYDARRLASPSQQSTKARSRLSVTRVLRRPRVIQDATEQAEFIAERSVETALRFLDSLEETFLKLAETPHIGSPCLFENPALASMALRRWPVKGFPKQWVFYRPLADGIEVIRVLHLARNVQRVLARDADDSDAPESGG